MSDSSDEELPLDYEQRAAVCSKDAALAALAGPGSGKTRVLSYRVRHLLTSFVAESREERGAPRDRRPDALTLAACSLRQPAARGVGYALLDETEAGLVALGRGWFVLNAREAQLAHREGPIGIYHWEADQEDFLVLSGEALLIVEGQERPLRQWDFVHCPAQTRHMIVGAGDGPCAVLAIGARR